MRGVAFLVVLAILAIGGGSCPLCHRDTKPVRASEDNDQPVGLPTVAPIV